MKQPPTFSARRSVMAAMSCIMLVSTAGVAMAEDYLSRVYLRHIRDQAPYFTRYGIIAPPKAKSAAKPVSERPLAPADSPRPLLVPADSPRPAAQSQPPAAAEPLHNANIQLAKAKPQDPLWNIISELRFGVLVHDSVFLNSHHANYLNPLENRYESGADFNPEIVFVSPDFLDIIFSPRFNIGGTINSGDDTNSAYAVASWDYIWDNDIFLEGFLGMAWHDGERHDGNPDNIEFGSRALFRLGAEVGWRWRKVHGVSFIWEHLSNAGWLSDKNQGINNIGFRYGYHFSH